MTEVFDSYKKKTTLYYVLLTITIVTILSTLIAKMTDVQVPHAYAPYLVAFVIFGISAIVINMLLTATNFVKMYVKNGELTVSTEYITINSVMIPLNEVKKIVIQARDYRGARSSDGSGNRIEVFVRSNETYACRFIINSNLQRANLLTILAKWNETGVTVTSSSF